MHAGGMPYDGIAILVRERAREGDPAYGSLWRDVTCAWCGTDVDHDTPRHHLSRSFDHLVPRAAGGGDEAANLLNSCALCNHIRDQKEPDAFRELVETAIRPHRDDLVAMGHALLAKGLLTEARIAWTSGGQSRTMSSRLIHAALGNGAFDPRTKKGFEDIVSIRSEGHARDCALMDTAGLVSLLRDTPGRSDLRRLRTLAAADAAALRDVVVRELKKRRRARDPTAMLELALPEEG